MRRRHRAMELRPIFLVIGVLLVVLAVFMVPPMVADLVVDNPDWQVFFISGAATAFVGVSLFLVNRGAPVAELSTRQAFLLTTSVWLVMSFFAALPLATSDAGLSWAEAVFEATSGLTTTGSTVIVGLDFAAPGLLLWRAILQWLGGIGIIVMGVAVLPMLSVGGMQLFRAESSDLSDKIVPRAAQLASFIGGIYLVLTVACGVLYWGGGMTIFEATAHAMTTVATGGFSTSDASLAHFDSHAIEWAAIPFMILGGIPFVLYIQFLTGNPLSLVRDTQVRWFLGIAGLSWVALTLYLVLEHGVDWEDGFRDAAFNATSVMTGTGYATQDFGAWGAFPVAALFFLMCVGGCTGSTTGGIKVFRFAVLYAVAKTQIQRLIRPHGVFPATYNRRRLPEAAAVSVMAFFFLFALSFSVLAVTLSLFGLDYLSAMSGALTSLANVGPGLGQVIGPVGTFEPLSDGAKWVLSAGMLLGRLELFTVLVLFAPGFWRG